MRLQLSDPTYTQKLASFFQGLGQKAVVSGPDQVEVVVPERGAKGAAARIELEIYLRVWRVLYPDAAVAVENGD
jgi:hypothetical protein